MSSFIAQFSIDSIELLDIAFSLDPKGPQGPIRAEVKLDHEFSGVRFIEERNRNVASVTLHVIANLEEDDADARMLMSASSTLCGHFSFSPFEDGPSDEETEEWILQNGISALYAHARSQIAFLASESPMKRFLLPPIYVQDYIEMHRAKSDDATGEPSPGSAD